MTDEHPTTDDGGVSAWLIAALIVVAIVLLVLFARGPEGEGRYSALFPLAAALITA
jgi:hypothetical protein